MYNSRYQVECPLNFALQKALIRTILAVGCYCCAGVSLKTNRNRLVGIWVSCGFVVFGCLGVRRRPLQRTRHRFTYGTGSISSRGGILMTYGPKWVSAGLPHAILVLMVISAHILWSQGRCWNTAVERRSRHKTDECDKFVRKKPLLGRKPHVKNVQGSNKTMFNF